MESDYIKLKDIKPALSGYIREAQALLELSAFPDEKVVHDVRVLMKKSKALMRLIVSQVEKEFYDREYGTFREIGRIMCLWRDTSVFRKIIKDIKKEKPDIFSSLNNNSNIELLLKKPDIFTDPSPDMKNDLERIKEVLSKSGYRIRFRPMNDMNPKILLDELDKSHGTTSRQYLICRNSMKPADIHEFRKRAKDLLYQLWFFRPLNPPVIKSLEKKLDSMTQDLGKYNDLYQLIRSLQYKYSENSNSPAMDELIILIRAKQDKYLSSVWPVAYKVFRPGRKLINISVQG